MSDRIHETMPDAARTATCEPHAAQAAEVQRHAPPVQLPVQAPAQNAGHDAGQNPGPRQVHAGMRS